MNVIQRLQIKYRAYISKQEFRTLVPEGWYSGRGLPNRKPITRLKYGYEPHYICDWCDVRHKSLEKKTGTSWVDYRNPASITYFYPNGEVCTAICKYCCNGYQFMNSKEYIKWKRSWKDERS